MSDFFYWLADNIAVWRPLAILVLCGVAIFCILFWLAVWESER